MILSHRKQFILLLSWKTASQSASVRLAAYNESPYDPFFFFNWHLNRLSNQHITAAEFVCLPESRLGYFTAAFVRNPYDRAYSGFRQLQKDIRAQPTMIFPEPWIRNLVLRQLMENFVQLNQAGFQFDNWMASITDEQVYELGRNTNFLLHPGHYWTHIAGDKVVDFIGKVETFETDFQAFITSVDLADVPRVDANVDDLEGDGHPSGYRYVDRMNAASIAKINRLFAADFELFNYPMLDPATHMAQLGLHRPSPQWTEGNLLAND